VKKLSSRYMPRWAARQFTTNVRVSVERIHEISVEDALAEGIDHHTMNDPRVEFQWLWDGINKSRGYGFDSKSFVFVIETPRGEYPT